MTLHTDPIPVEISKATRLANRDIMVPAGRPGGSSKEIETQQGGIFGNITDPGQLRDDRIQPEYWLAGLGGLVKLFDAELMTNESYVLLHRPEDRAREDLQELTQWILKSCRVA